MEAAEEEVGGAGGGRARGAALLGEAEERALGGVGGELGVRAADLGQHAGHVRGGHGRSRHFDVRVGAVAAARATGGHDVGAVRKNVHASAVVAIPCEGEILAYGSN